MRKGHGCFVLHATLLQNRISFISCNVLFHVTIMFSLVVVDDIALLDLNVHNTSLIEIIETIKDTKTLLVKYKRK